MEPSSQTISFCDELRKAREYQGLSLAEIAKLTRIPREYLEALENGSFDVIPEPIQRGVIKAYAQAAGMNADKVLNTLEVLRGIRHAEETGSLSTDRGARESLTVGMTRAQIRTAWFATIANNRFLHWGLTLLLLLVGVMLAAQWRAGGQQSFLRRHELLPVGEPESSFRPSPLFEVEEKIPDSLRYRLNFPIMTCELIALDTSHLSLIWGLQEDSQIYVYPHDKLKFTHFSGLRIGSHSGFRGLLVAESDTFGTHFTKDSLTTWLCYPDALSSDSTEGVAMDSDSASG